jgi:hypothetical protein
MTALQFPQLPASFYDSTPYLRHIRQAAHYYRCAPDAVLVATLCRIAAATPPTTYIDTPEPTPLNLIGALIAAPGNGKSLANTTAFRLVPDLGLGVNDSLPLGTGEGLVESYFESVSVLNDTGKGKHIEKRQAYKSGYFYCDEGETLFTLTTRKGATILQTLRTAWSGGVLGNTNANLETRRKLDRNSYRACVVVMAVRRNGLSLRRRAIKICQPSRQVRRAYSNTTRQTNRSQYKYTPKFCANLTPTKSTAHVAPYTLTRLTHTSTTTESGSRHYSHYSTTGDT